MSKQDQIRDLFKDFGRGDFFKFNECRPDFSCEHDNKHDNKCGVNQDADHVVQDDHVAGVRVRPGVVVPPQPGPVASVRLHSLLLVYV